MSVAPDRGAEVPRYQRTRLRFTREGRIFVLVTLLVGIAAVNTGHNLLYLVLGLLLSLITLSGVMSEISLRGIRIARRFPRRAFAGSPALIEIAVTNEKRSFPSFSLEVEDFARGEPTDRRCFFLKVAPGGTQIIAYPRTHETRGIAFYRGFRVATRYPFGIFEKSRWIDVPGEFVVYPKLLPAAEVATMRRRGDAFSHARPGQGAEVDGVRELRTGDTSRDVHWIRTASAGRFVVRSRREDAAEQLTLEIDNRVTENSSESDSRSPEALEAQISRAAAIGTAALARGTSVEVVAEHGTSGVIEGRRAPDPLWRFLALIPTIPKERAQ